MQPAVEGVPSVKVTHKRPTDIHHAVLDRARVMMENQYEPEIVVDQLYQFARTIASMTAFEEQPSEMLRVIDEARRG